MIQITPQMRILVAIEAVDGRKGIDSLARLCQEKLQSDPFSGCLFVFRSRRGTSIRILVYDGQGFWLAQKRLSQGRFVWWPSGKEPARRLEAHQAQLLLAAGNPETEAAPVWRKVSGEGPKQNTYVLIFSVACCCCARNMALPRPRDRSPADCLSKRVHSSASHQQPLEAVAAIMRSTGLETGR
ncbi:MAG TPA: IS66 family insertion sequence element accessory protein TnpB [Dongiaceae bacterium]|nr:IS66 family insertion sequence element accessory protein TnpB [Dongiaceae bacterium]